MRKICSISPRPEFRHFKPVYDVSRERLSHGHFVGVFFTRQVYIFSHIHVVPPCVRDPHI